MTIRQQFERRIGVAQRLAFAGSVLYFVPLAGMYRSPWFTAAAGMGLMLCIAAACVAAFGLRCPECGKTLIHLLAATCDRRLLAVRSDITTCNHCGADFDVQEGNDGLPEIMSGQELPAGFIGVVDVAHGDGVTRYELTLHRHAKEAFRQILLLSPFRKQAVGALRYFYVPASHLSRRRHGDAPAVIRVERNNESKNVEVDLPDELRSTLELLLSLGDSGYVTGVAVRTAPLEQARDS